MMGVKLMLSVGNKMPILDRSLIMCKIDCVRLEICFEKRERQEATGGVTMISSDSVVDDEFGRCVDELAVVSGFT